MTAEADRDFGAGRYAYPPRIVMRTWSVVRRLGVVPVVPVLLAGCTGQPADLAVEVLPIEEVLASEIVVEPDPSGTVATVRVETAIPVICAVVYGAGEDFGSIATDDDMAGGAHREHAPRMSGLEPATEYRYVLQGSDAHGNLYRSEVMTFLTPDATDAAPPGRNVAPQGAAVDVSSEFSDAFPGSNAIDGDLATEWSSAGDGDYASITIDLGRSVAIVGVRLRTREMSDGSAIIHTYTVTIEDGQPFGPFSVGPDSAVAELTAEGRRFRFDAAETSGGNTGAVEIEIYADE